LLHGRSSGKRTYFTARVHIIVSKRVRLLIWFQWVTLRPAVSSANLLGGIAL
jgi:hypothetical protein